MESIDCLYLIFIFFLFCFFYSSNKNPAKVLPAFEKKLARCSSRPPAPANGFKTFLFEGTVAKLRTRTTVKVGPCLVLSRNIFRTL